MAHRKPLPAFFVIAGIITVGCGGTSPPRPKRTAAEPVWDPVEVPDTIAASERPQLEKTLFLMPAKHPARLDLRNRLAESYAASFEGSPPEAINERLDLFESSLALHQPEDFKPGHVAAVLAPLARWVIDCFERRGDEAVVLAAYRFLIIAEPDDVRHAEHYQELSEWSESVRATIPHEIGAVSSAIEMYTQMLRLVPDREVVDHLAGLLITRHQLMLQAVEQSGRAGDVLTQFMLRAMLQENGIAKEMIHVYFLAGDAAGALPHLEGLGIDAGIEAEYIDLLRDIGHGNDLAESYFAIAGMLGAKDPRSGLRACILARRHDRSDPRFPVCVGRFFEFLGHPECAVDFYTEAADSAPEEEVFAQVLELVRVALFEIHLAEKAEEARRVIDLADGLVERALELRSDEKGDLSLSAAHMLFTAGEVEFDDGRIDSAVKHFQRSSEVWPSLFRAQMKVAEVLHLRRRYREALELLAKALQAARGDDDVSNHYWAALLHERRGDCFTALGDSDAARKEYRASLLRWNDVQLSPVQAPEAAVRQGVLQDRLGNLDESTTAFKLAVRLDPDRRATYAEVLSFLITRGRLEDAVEFYRLAFNQDRIESMWKIYYSMWVEGLARRTGKPSVDLARGYLEQSNGTSWQDELARFFSGRITYQQLRDKAANTGQIVETDYYSALLHLAKGEEGIARERLEKVIQSNLMGFFEYRMAWELLRSKP